MSARPRTRMRRSPPTISPHKLEYTQWLHALRSFLDDFLKSIIPDDAIRNRLFETKEQMDVWEKAFTHETFGPTNNYEELEFLGDALLETVFAKYLMRKFPTLDKKEYTELKVAYMSKIRQAEMTRQMGLTPYVRVAGISKASLNIDTDVFESFFGALDTVSDMVEEGWGYLNCFHLISALYDNIKIDTTLTEGSPKTQVIQMFVRFELPAPIESVYDGNPGTEVSIYLTDLFVQMLTDNGFQVDDPLFALQKAPREKMARINAAVQAVESLKQIGLLEVDSERKTRTGAREVDFSISLKQEHLDFLKEYGIDIPDPMIGRATGKTKKEADSLAYADAQRTLAEYGVTTKWATAVKRQRDFEDPDIAKYVPTALARSKTDGFETIYFFIPRKTVTDKGSVVALVGVRSDGTQETLEVTYTTDRSNMYRHAKTELIQKYAEFR